MKNIRPIFLIIIFQVCYITIFSQSSFELHFPTSGRALPVDGIETIYGEYVFLINNYTNSPELMHPTIVKANASGEIIKEEVVNFKDVITLRKIFYDDVANKFLIIGLCVSYPEPLHEKIFISEWTHDLELLEYHEFENPFQDYIVLTAAINDSDGRIILTGHKYYPPLNGFIFEVDDEFLLVDSLYLDFSCMISSICIIQSNDSLGFLLSFTGKPPGFNSSGEYLMKLDNSLNVIDYYSTNLLSGIGMTTITNYADTLFLATGKHIQINHRFALHRNVVSKIIDHQNNLLTSNIFGKQPDTVDFPGLYNGAVVIDNENIYVPGTSNVNISQYPYAPTPSWFMLNKTYGNLNLKWQKFYGGDAHYFLYSIIPTSDGGCVMMGTRYHPDNPTGIDAYILKVGPDGLVSVPEIGSSLQVHEVILYPNPGTSRLYIQTGHDDLKISFYNTNGSLHFKDKINRLGHAINTTSWPAGAYLYQITKGTDIIDSGKWIKAE